MLGNAEGSAHVVGTVRELWRYPVKSLQGEPVTAVELTASGIEGDRAWGIMDPVTGRVLSAKTVPRLLEAGATTEEGTVVVRLPDGAVLDVHDPAADRVLSAWLDRPVALRPAEGSESRYQMTFDPPDDDADLVDIPTPPGTLFDLTAVHLLTTGSLATAAAAHPDGDWAPRRFRPNLLVESRSDDDYPEDAWVDRSVTVGTAELRVLMRTVRCAIPLRAQPAAAGRPALDRDVGIFRTLADLHDNHIGAYAEVAAPGRLTVGEPVRLA